MANAYRTLVSITARSRVAMITFTLAACVVAPALATSLIMNSTNPEDDAARERVLRARESVDGRATRAKQRADLGAMLADAREGGAASEARWRAALGVKE